MGEWHPFGRIYGREKEGVQEMSQHPSLKSASKIRARRNVLKRFERIDLLKEQGKWKDGDRATGLPKTKSDQ
jgi:small basic protein (TIGR04137 family)